MPHVGRPLQQLELVHRERTLAVGRAEAVGAGIAAADDHDALALGGDDVGRRHVIPRQPPILLRQILDREVHAGELAAGNLKVARPRRPAAEHDRVELAAQAGHRQIDADLDAGPELDAFRRHQRQPAIDEALFELELGDAVAQQAADAVGPFEDGHVMPGLVQLVGSGEAGRTRADDGHALTGAHGRRPRLNPSVLERVLDDRQLDRLDGDRVVVDAEHARAFARRRAQPARPLRKVVRRVQPIARRLPALVIDEIVPVGNDVAERAALMTERNAAVHAPGALVAHLRVGLGQIDFLPVAEALRDGPGLRLRALDLDETGGLTHWRPLRPAR